jgi:hypothetical protein
MTNTDKPDNNLAHKILCNLVFNAEYRSRVLQHFKPEYFERPPFRLTFKLIAAISSTPTKQRLLIDLKQCDGIHEETYKEAIATIESLSPDKDSEHDLDWLISRTETWCKEQAVYNGLKKGLDVYGSTESEWAKTKQQTPWADRCSLIPSILQEAATVSFIDKENYKSGAGLMTKTFEPIKYVVPNYIVEGVTLLAGKPKIGKSWLGLDMAIAVATGGTVLGEQCEQGDVLYCALEDNERRLQDRIQKIAPNEKLWDRFTYTVEMPRLPQCIEYLRRWLHH